MALRDLGLRIGRRPRVGSEDDGGDVDWRMTAGRQSKRRRRRDAGTGSAMGPRRGPRGTGVRDWSGGARG
jgi:hypothetical protein